jgi:chitinase
MNRRFFGPFVVALLLLAAPFSAQGQGLLPPRIVGYYAGWAVYDRQYFVRDIPADKLTHLNYAFANVSEDGEVILGDEWGDTQMPMPGDDENAPLLGNFHQLQLLRQAHPNLKTLISVGGWSQSAHFSDAALTPESRAKFARSAVNFAVKYGFDGVDIDWEYPTGGGDSGNVERPEDPANFVLLLTELRNQLSAQGAEDGKPYLLTIALAAEPRGYEPLDWTKLVPLLDWINVMSYDMAGGWSAATSFNSPLYTTPSDPPDAVSTDSVLRALVAVGIPADRLVMGVPFYGRGWIGVPADNNGLHQTFTGLAPGTWDQGDFDYSDLTANYIGKYPTFFDENAQSPWLYAADRQIMISYENPRSLAAKAQYVRANGYGGIMFWELSADHSGELVSALYDGLNGQQPVG